MPDEQSQSFQYRRMPAIPRKISDINPEKDIRVRLLGRVIDKSDNTIIIDDGSGKAEIIVENESDFERLNINDVLRIFTRVLPLETGYELRSEIIHDMNKLDLDLYKKIYEE